jgi:hypothetical protein
MRNEQANFCSSVRSTPMGGTTDGSHTSRPPRRAALLFVSKVVMTVVSILEKIRIPDNPDVLVLS